LGRRGYRFHPDGSASSNTVNYAYAFDRAVGSPSGTYAVIYAERGTKGLVLGCQFESTGAPTSSTPVRRSLTDGRYLLSAGWAWHPLNMLMVFDLEAALEDATTLDGRGVMDPYACVGEVEFAAFDGSQHVLVMWAALMASQLARTRRCGGPGQLGRWSLPQSRWETRVPLTEPAGILMPLGPYVVSFYHHPKLIVVMSEATPQQVHGVADGSIPAIHVRGYQDGHDVASAALAASNVPAPTR
jgi:hypothetical protein